jgi:microcystin-dependent protein
MNALALTAVGSGQAHNNVPPYLTLTFCIALQGIFPSQN